MLILTFGFFVVLSGVGEIMGLLTKLSVKLFTLFMEKEKGFEDKLNDIDELTLKLLKTEGVHYYLLEENRMEQENLKELLDIGASQEVAKTLSKSIKFLRSKALYNNFGIGRIPEEKLKLVYDIIDELSVREAINHFNRKGVKIDMFGKRFGVSDSMTLEDRKLIDVVNFVTLLNWQIQYADYSGEKIDCFQLSRNAKVKAIVADLEEKNVNVK